MRFKSRKKRIVLIACTLLFAQSGYGNEFNLNEIPPGKSITIGSPATTLVPLHSSSRFAPSDLPQTLKFLLTGSNEGVKVAIYDSNSEKVEYVTIRQGIPFLYSFKDLRPIMVKPQTAFMTSSAVRMMVESDKPLEVGR
jgi:hypothetical protein